MDDILVSLEAGTAYLTLNRPQALNALTSTMIDDLTRWLLDWAGDDRVERVVLAGRGRGLCAGADVRQLRQAVIDHRIDPIDFLRREYALDWLVATYPKPFRAVMSGIVMGGGMGLSVHASHRVVDATTTLAMPETIIGLWPDVGVSYHLARLPGELGTWMALTGLPISGTRGLEVGLADAMAASPAPSVAVADRPPSDSAWMVEAFAGDDPLAILERLSARPELAAGQALAAIRARSPWSVAVSLAALRRAAKLTLWEVFAQDMVIGANLVGRADFVEGVRAQLIDKDYRPRWSFARIEDVPVAAVAAVFADGPNSGSSRGSGIDQLADQA